MTKRLLLLTWLIVIGLPSAALAQPVGPEFQVNTYTTGFQSSPSVASDASGNFTVVWGSPQDGDGGGIFSQRYDSTGVPLGVEFQVNSYTTGWQSYPSVSSDASGNFVVVWEGRGKGDTDGVFGQRYDSAGNPLGGEFQVNYDAYNYKQEGEVSVASVPSGNFIVVWVATPSPSFSFVLGQLFDSDGNKLGGQFQASSSGHGPDVAAEASGNFVVVWRDNYEDENSSNILGQRYDNGGNRLGGSFQVNTSDYAYDPSIGAEPGGNFVVVWKSWGQDGSGLGIIGRRYNSEGDPLSEEFQVNTYTTANQSNPSVTSDAIGNFVVAWPSAGQDGSQYGVFGQRYDFNGNPVRDEFQVNTYTTNDQAWQYIAPSIASDAAGNFVVVWQSYGQDGSYGGVFGQRFLGGVSGGCRSTALNPSSLCPENPR